jgi:hypothetical protein
MFMRSLLLLLVVTITRIVPFLCSEIDITNIGTNICDVEKNKRSYDTFKTGRPECLSTYEEKLDFYHATVKHKNIFAYLQTITSSWIDGQAYAAALKENFLRNDKGLYKVDSFNIKTNMAEFTYLHYIRGQTGYLCQYTDYFCQKTGYLCFIRDYFCQNIEYHIRIFSGKFQRGQDSPNCGPTDDPIRRDDNTLERARLYLLYRELQSKSMIENTLDATCPALKDRSDL